MLWCQIAGSLAFVGLDTFNIDSRNEIVYKAPMKKEQCIEKALKAGLHIGPDVAFKLKADLIFRNKQTREIKHKIHKGARIRCAFIGAKHVALEVSPDGDVEVLPIIRALLYFGWRMPGIKELRKTGMARTVTGKLVEPDGIGEDGSPSWLLALGYI